MLKGAERDARFATMDELARLMEPVRHRWESLAVRGREPDHFDSFLDALARGTPTLKYCLIASQMNTFNGPERHFHVQRLSQHRHHSAPRAEALSRPLPTSTTITITIKVSVR